jgi:hypothetical protein
MTSSVLIFQNQPENDRTMSVSWVTEVFLRKRRHIMIGKILAICGVIIFVVSIVFALILWVASRQATQLNAFQSMGWGGGPGVGPVAPCTISSVNVPTVMSDHESQPVIVNFSQSEPGAPGCEDVVSINAPGFDVSPHASQQSFTMPPHRETTSVSWILSPKKQGTYTVQVSKMGSTYTYGISITDVFGLNVWQVGLLAKIGSVLGSLLTLVFTANSWWWDRLREMLNKRRKKATMVQALPVATTSVVCPKCGFANRRGAKFCQRDGQPLTRGEDRAATTGISTVAS